MILERTEIALEVAKKRKTARGSLAEYANPDLKEQEKTAWEKAVTERYGNA